MSTLLQSSAASGFLGQLLGWQQAGISDLHPATPIATKPLQSLPQVFFCRPAEQIAPELIGCLLVKRQGDVSCWGSRMLNRLVEKGRSKGKRISPGQQQLPFAFDLRLNQIPDNWHQVAVRFRRANGIRDGDRERSIW